MDYKIIGDSCLDLTAEQKKDSHFMIIPLTLQVGDYHVVDDDTFDQLEFIRQVHSSPIGAKTGCPSPELFRQAFEETNQANIFVITLSEHLSGTYQSATVGLEMYADEMRKAGENPTVETIDGGTIYRGSKNICIISSHSASSGEQRVAMQVSDMCEADTPFDDICRAIFAFRDSMKTYFVLESLETLRKNGRLSGTTALIANVLNIKPIMAGEKGVIVKLDQARGMKKALEKMVQIAISQIKDGAQRAVVTHVNNLERGHMVRDMLVAANKFKEVIVCSAAGVTTVYAGDGGIVLAVG